MMITFKKLLVIGLALLVSAALTACQTIQYYSQAINGQHRILQSRQPISEVTADPNSSEVLRRKLTFILDIRAFAEDELQLPVANNYLTYVDVKKPYVAWNVVAAPEFSMVPKTWCYPFVGCAAYRGYFAKTDAEHYAGILEKQGYDVHVGGVTAYSTLGWFDDPVLSTFIRRSKASAAALLFHEVAHQVLYAPDDTTFNESFATFVEQEGLRRWQEASGDPAIYGQYLNNYRRQQQFVGLVQEHRQKLEELYQTDLAPHQKRTRKASIFSDLRNEFNQLKAVQADLAVYENWMRQPLNNAKISGVVAYHDFVPAFSVILKDNDGDLSRFYDACRRLAQKQKDERHRILKQAMQKGPETAMTAHRAFQLEK
jgi:predicted aminopeptidase